MRVKDLIAELQKLPPEAEVGIVYDGSDRMDLSSVWLATSGRVLVGEEDGPVYYAEDWQKGFDNPKDLMLVYPKNWE